MRATRKNKKNLTNQYLKDIVVAMSHVSPKNILPAEEFVRLPMATMKHVYDKQLTVLKWIRHDIEVLYNIVNDKEFEPFDGNKYFQTWLKLKENENKKKKKLSDFIKED